MISFRVLSPNHPLESQGCSGLDGVWVLRMTRRPLSGHSRASLGVVKEEGREITPAPLWCCEVSGCYSAVTVPFALAIADPSLDRASGALDIGQVQPWLPSGSQSS